MELGYYVYNSANMNWLNSDERSWGSFFDAAVFSSKELAEEIGQRANVKGDPIYVMCCY